MKKLTKNIICSLRPVIAGSLSLSEVAFQFSDIIY